MNYIKLLTFRNFRILITRFISKLQYHNKPMFFIYNLRGYKFNNTYKILDILKPGDILLKTYDNYATNLFIPGTWKHAGLAIDNKTIINAVGGGVEFTDTIQFCRTDKICILRSNAPEEQIKQIVTTAKEQLGKQYDYDFLALDHSKFYCSELVVYCYNSIFKIDPSPKKMFGFLPTPAEVTPSDIFACKYLNIIYNSMDDNV